MPALTIQDIEATRSPAAGIWPRSGNHQEGMGMDYSLLSAATTAISAARDLGKAAIGIRDFNQMATVVSQLNDQLLKAQESLFTHNTQLLALQQELFEAHKKLREVEKTIEQRSNYTLVEITDGVFAYRANSAPVDSGASKPGSTQVAHYACQPCLDKGQLGVLHRKISGWIYVHACPLCKVELPSGEHVEIGV